MAGSGGRIVKLANPEKFEPPWGKYMRGVLVWKATGEVVKRGTPLIDEEKGEVFIVNGWSYPNSPNSSGRVYVTDKNGQEHSFFPHVFGMKIIDEPPKRKKPAHKISARRRYKHMHTPYAFVGYDGRQYLVGQKVELHPSTDLWMRGAKTGTVVKFIIGTGQGGPHPGGLIKVRSDHPAVKKLITIRSGMVKKTLQRNPKGFRRFAGGWVRKTPREPRITYKRHKIASTACLHCGKQCTTGFEITNLPHTGKLPYAPAHPKCWRYVFTIMRPLLQEKLREVKKKINPLPFYVCAHRHGGEWMCWDGEKFSNNTKPVAYISREGAIQAAHRIWNKHPKLRAAGYGLYVVDASRIQKINAAARRGNPAPLDGSVDETAQKFKDFTGREATHATGYKPRSADKTAMELGRVKAIEYIAKRDKETSVWRHPFKAKSRPLLAASTDGKQLHIVGGQYEVTDAGIEDR